jgi:hydroxymethylpyrimidine/phosphomethylpyrimidine kinase
MTAVTALTAQDTLGVHDILPVPPAFVTRQMRVVLNDIGADSIKIGMLGNAEIAIAVAEVLESHDATAIPVVLDTVMAATRGGLLLDGPGLEILKRRLIPLAMLITPNLPEAEALTGLTVRDLDGMRRAADLLLAMGPRNVLIKGGHLEGDALVDILVGADGEAIFRHPRIPSRHTHGTGCVLSSAIAARMARSVPLKAAVTDALAHVQAAIRAAPGFGAGNGPLGVVIWRAIDDTA